MYLENQIGKLLFSSNMSACMVGDNKVAAFSDILLKLGKGLITEKYEGVSIANYELCTILKTWRFGQHNKSRGSPYFK